MVPIARYNHSIVPLCGMTYNTFASRKKLAELTYGPLSKIYAHACNNAFYRWMQIDPVAACCEICCRAPCKPRHIRVAYIIHVNSTLFCTRQLDGNSIGHPQWPRNSRATIVANNRSTIVTTNGSLQGGTEADSVHAVHPLKRHDDAEVRL